MRKMGPAKNLSAYSVPSSDDAASRGPIPFPQPSLSTSPPLSRGCLPPPVDPPRSVAPVSIDISNGVAGIFHSSEVMVK